MCDILLLFLNQIDSLTLNIHYIIMGELAIMGELSSA